MPWWSLHSCVPASAFSSFKTILNPAASVILLKHKSADVTLRFSIVQWLPISLTVKTKGPTTNYTVLHDPEPKLALFSHLLLCLPFTPLHSHWPCFSSNSCRPGPLRDFELATPSSWKVPPNIHSAHFLSSLRSLPKRHLLFLKFQPLPSDILYTPPCLFFLSLVTMYYIL